MAKEQKIKPDVKCASVKYIHFAWAIFNLSLISENIKTISRISSGWFKA
ncbi:MAG: hypothetical protein KBA43_05295 [Paludibacteraceae bacterium]|jgi:hypothetical protein|nr:hypothetical protein [Paludibacteraceae bacterium]